jgi:hypothetical protein
MSNTTEIPRILDLKKLHTSEDESEREELANLELADAHAGSFIIAGPLLDPLTAGDPLSVRLYETVSKLSGLKDPLDPSREDWAYRLGLMVGLRLALALAPVAAKGGAQ